MKLAPTHDMSTAPEDANKHAFHVSSGLVKVALGVAALGAVIAAPHILPSLVSNPSSIYDAAHVLSVPSGLASGINSALAGVPLIGASLAHNGIFNVTATAIAGFGGLLLSNIIEKHEDGTNSIKWSKVIRYAAIATTAIIALPTVLTSISMGLGAIAAAINVPLANTVIGGLAATIGSMGQLPNIFMGMTGAAAALPHLLTCGMPLIPVAMAISTSHKKAQEESFALRVQREIGNPLSADADIRMDIEIPEKLQLGVPCTAKITLRHSQSGEKLTAQELAVVHTEKLHMMVVDKTLFDYQHIHPQPQSDGTFTCSFTPQTANSYNAWVDITTVADNKNHKLKSELPCKLPRNIAPVVRINDAAQSTNLEVHMSLSDPLQKGHASVAEFIIADKNGAPVTDLEPVMGAYAHLVGFSADGKTLLHSHPLGAEPTDNTQRGGPKLRFHVEPESAGPTQFYLQVKHHGNTVMLPFGQRIKLPELATERVNITRTHAAHAAHSL